jgi:hypothetical protein
MLKYSSVQVSLTDKTRQVIIQVSATATLVLFLLESLTTRCLRQFVNVFVVADFAACGSKISNNMNR